MPNLAAIAAPVARLCGGGQNESRPRTAAHRAAALAALALALCACAQPPPSQPSPLTATPAPLPLSLAIPAPTAAPPSFANPPLTAQPPTSSVPLPPAPIPLPPTPATQPDLAPDPYASIPIPEDVAFTQITAGQAHACGLSENGAIACWGGDPERLGILDAPDETGFRQISAGLNFTCGLRPDSTIACWGDNSHGKATPPQGAFTEIAASEYHACALPLPQSATPELVCWGRHFPNGAESIPLDTPISDIQTGVRFVCGLTPQADMACVRINQRLTEITPGPFTQLAAGAGHLCALREDGSAFCQGRNDSMQASPPPTKFTHIAAGRFHSCGITRASRIECWGSSVRGAPGERLAAPDGEFASITIGWRNSCALRPNGRAACWGTRSYMSPSTAREFANLPNGVSLAFGGANFNSPVDIFQWQSGGIAVVEREGAIAAHLDRPDAPPPQTILDLTDAVVCCDDEDGMLSAALDPQFEDFPFLYVWYKTLADNALGEGAPGYVGRLARFRVNSAAAVKGSELPILEVPLPNRWHLGGAVRFGADGMLYLGIGDNQTQAAAQSLDNLRGKIIRIDVRGANTRQPYRVPPDNPFVNNPDALPEIWAYGLRNPWRMAFDPKNPASLFVADVGNQTREEVSIATAGANLGWPLCEADICQESLDPAAAARLTPPAVAYGRDIGCAIIGGVTVPWLNDAFIFGDLCARRVWLLERDSASAGAQGWRMREIADIVDAIRSILALGATDNGSVYILTYDGPILRLAPTFADNLPDAQPNE